MTLLTLPINLDILELPPEMQDRITVNLTTGCWIMPDTGHSQGYSRTRYEGYRWLSHRLTWTLIIGPIPEGLEIDHLCRVKMCCNPQHLEPVTHAENVRRGMAPGAVSARTRMCKRGLHAMVDDNVYVEPDRSSGRKGARCCRACRQTYKAGATT